MPPSRSRVSQACVCSRIYRNPSLVCNRYRSESVVELNVPSWERRRPQQGSTCSPSASGAVSTSHPWRTSGWWVWCPLCWPPFRIAVVVGCPGVAVLESAILRVCVHGRPLRPLTARDILGSLESRAKCQAQLQVGNTFCSDA